MFDYLCTKCGTETPFPPFRRLGEKLDEECILCGSRPLTRCVSAVNAAPVMQEHFNTAVGKPISSMSQFRSELSRKSDLQSEYTGTEARFVPTDMTDAKALGVTDEGLDITAKMKQDTGRVPSTKKIIT